MGYLDLIEQDKNYEIGKVEKQKTALDKQVEAAKALLTADVTKQKTKIQADALTDKGKLVYGGAKTAEAQKVNDLYGGNVGGAMVFNQQRVADNTQTNVRENQIKGDTLIAEQIDKEQKGISDFETQKANALAGYNQDINDINYKAETQKEIARRAEAEATAKAQAEVLKQNAQNIKNQLEFKAKKDGVDVEGLIADYIKNPDIPQDQKQALLDNFNYSSEFINNTFSSPNTTANRITQSTEATQKNTLNVQNQLSKLYSDRVTNTWSWNNRGNTNVNSKMDKPQNYARETVTMLNTVLDNLNNGSITENEAANLIYQYELVSDLDIMRQKGYIDENTYNYFNDNL